jgi:hypothetical protein
MRKVCARLREFLVGGRAVSRRGDFWTLEEVEESDLSRFWAKTEAKRRMIEGLDEDQSDI